MTDTQLRLRLEALGRDSAFGRPALQRSEGRRRPEGIGFQPNESGVWVRSWSVSLARLGLSPETFSGERLREISDVIDQELGGPVILFDLETTGLRRGAGSVPFLYGWGEVKGEELLQEQWLLPDFDGEPALVTAALQKMRGAGALLTYNGSSFDVPLLRARAVMTAVDGAWPEPPHLDLLLSVRRLFRHRLRRCTLRQVEQELLREYREDDLPGSEAPARYREYLFSGEAAPLEAVARHNALDVTALARLTGRLEQHLEAAPEHPSDWYSLGRFAESRGNWHRARDLYQSAASAAPPPLDRAAALRQARLLRRRGQELEARLAWRSVWERWRDPEAAEALCVDLEHRGSDPAGALTLAQEALKSAPAGWDQRLARRIWRLQAKLGREARVERPLSRPDDQQPWAPWLPGGESYAVWLALRRETRSRESLHR